MKTDLEMAASVNKVHNKEYKILDVVSTVVFGIAAFGAGMMAQYHIHGNLWNKNVKNPGLITDEQPKEETSETETTTSE